jgi:hypothetical protein
MKRIIVISMLAFLFTLVLVPISNGQMAKEGSGKGKSFYVLNFTMLPMGEEVVQVNYEGYGISQGEMEDNIFNNASIHVVGGLLEIKGTYENDSGLIGFSRPDGDQIFATYKCSGQIGKTGKGTYTIVGGTGKLVGIQGQGEFNRFMLRPPAKGVGASYSTTEGSWKIVEPSK